MVNGRRGGTGEPQNDENSDYAENIYDHFDAPRISVLYDDLIDTMYGTPGYADLDYSLHGEVPASGGREDD